MFLMLHHSLTSHLEMAVQTPEFLVAGMAPEVGLTQELSLIPFLALAMEWGLILLPLLGVLML